MENFIFTFPEQIYLQTPPKINNPNQMKEDSAEVVNHAVALCFH